MGSRRWDFFFGNSAQCCHYIVLGIIAVEVSWLYFLALWLGYQSSRALRLSVQNKGKINSKIKFFFGIGI